MMLQEEDTKKEPSEVLEPMLLLDFLKNFKMETIVLELMANTNLGL